MTPGLQVGYASCLSFLPISGDRPNIHTLSLLEGGLIGEFSVVRGLPPMLPWATLSAPPTCMEWDFGKATDSGCLSDVGEE